MSRLREFFRNDCGGAAMMFGLAAVPITVAAGGALDFTRAGVERSELQAKADSAALGAVLARSVTTDAQRGDIAKKYFRATDIVTPVVSGPIMTVAVTASREMKTTLLSIVGKKSLTIVAKATAIRTTQGPPACAIALNKHAASAIEFGGNTSFTAPNCGMYSNSDSSTAITSGGSASVNAAGYCAVGGVNMASNTKPEPITGCDSISDPYASPSLVPANTTCTTNNFKTKPSDNVTISAGVYCGGMDMKGTVKLNPGVYIVKNGPLTVNSGANISGDGVVFYMMGTGAGYKLNGGGTINLKASNAAGPYKGLLIVQDSASNVGYDNTLNGDANMNSPLALSIRRRNPSPSPAMAASGKARRLCQSSPIH